jgi:hypothetical protein
VDWLTRAIERLPGPTWLAYVALLLVALAYIALEGVVSDIAIGVETVSYFGYAFFFVYPLAAYHYLARGAASAWDALRPVTVLDDAAAMRMRAEISTTPARPVAVIWALTAVANAATALAYPAGFDLANRPPAYVVLRVVSESLWVAPVAIVLVYLVVRQLRIVARLHREVAQVDLLRPRPLHALSRLTARSAITLVVLAVASGLPLPGVSEAAWLGTILFFSLPFLVLAAFVFFVPLRGMHGRLSAEKEWRVGEVSARLDATTEALHRLVDQETANHSDAERSRLAQTRIDALNKALASLLAERDFVRRVSPWPWDASTFRAVVSAVGLPIALFLVYRLLERFV